MIIRRAICLGHCDLVRSLIKGGLRTGPVCRRFEPQTQQSRYPPTHQELYGRNLDVTFML